MVNTNTQRLRILVVEDNRDLAANIGDYFAAKGHTVDFATDGVTGLHLAVTAILIMDAAA